MKWMWAIIQSCAIFVLKSMFNVLVRCLHEDSRQNPWYWMRVNSILIRKLVWLNNYFHSIFHPHKKGVIKVHIYTMVALFLPIIKLSRAARLPPSRVYREDINGNYASRDIKSPLCQPSTCVHTKWGVLSRVSLRPRLVPFQHDYVFVGF